MKRVLSLILFSPLIAPAQKTDEGFIISGKVNGLPDNSVVYFAGNDESQASIATICHSLSNQPRVD